jgi:hypothetical protein
VRQRTKAKKNICGCKTATGSTLKSGFGARAEHTKSDAEQHANECVFDANVLPMFF